MRTWLAIAALSFTLNVHASPASTESIERLFVAMKAESMMESIYGGAEQAMQEAMKQTVGDRPLAPEQQRVLDAVPAKFVAVMRQELSWQKTEPLYVQVYRETFEQEEVDGLIALYTSPAGRAFVDKMPLVMSKSFALSQSMMQSLFPKMKAAIEEAVAEAKIAK